MDTNLEITGLTEEQLRIIEELNNVTIKNTIASQIFEDSRNCSEVKEKISTAMKNRTVSDEHRRKISNGLKSHYIQNGSRKVSDEVKQKISDSLKGQLFSDERKHKISQANKGRKWSNNLKEAVCKLTEDDVLKIRSDFELYMRNCVSYGCKATYIQDTANKYGVAFPTIDAILRRRTWKHI